MAHFRNYFTHCIFRTSHSAGFAQNAKDLYFMTFWWCMHLKLAQSTQRVHNPVQTVRYSRLWSLCHLGVDQLACTPCRNFTSAVRYSRIAALYTAAVAPTRPWLVVLDFRCLWMRPTGNWKIREVWTGCDDRKPPHRTTSGAVEPQQQKHKLHFKTCESS